MVRSFTKGRGEPGCSSGMCAIQLTACPRLPPITLCFPRKPPPPPPPLARHTSMCWAGHMTDASAGTTAELSGVALCSSSGTASPASPEFTHAASTETTDLLSPPESPSPVSQTNKSHKLCIAQCGGGNRSHRHREKTVLCYTGDVPGAHLHVCAQLVSHATQFQRAARRWCVRRRRRRRERKRKGRHSGSVTPALCSRSPAAGDAILSNLNCSRKQSAAVDAALPFSPSPLGTLPRSLPPSPSRSLKGRKKVAQCINQKNEKPEPGSAFPHPSPLLSFRLRAKRRKTARKGRAEERKKGGGEQRNT